MGRDSGGRGVERGEETGREGKEKKVDRKSGLFMQEDGGIWFYKWWK